MPAATAEPPAVVLSFANNFWGKYDAGVDPLLDRMHGAKQTCDELKAFYSARASIEDEYSRKLLNLCRKSLGSQEMGTLKASLDTVRGEVESMAKQHQNVAAQMKSELEEPLAVFAGGMKERRKIVQFSVERLLKTKTQQTRLVNKTRDRYEQECLKVKGYLAQGHMVMGQEERRNKEKLEKTQISLATANSEYEKAAKALEETTLRWNREWKSAADKFQDLEEERLDFMKSSLWTFANVASTVCVSDDASCEKIRLSLEKMEVEKDIASFITERGTGQEIPDAPKYVNFCRGDLNDSQSEASEDDNYSVAQFPRSINPAFRSSSPQPSTFESHHNPNSPLAKNLAHREALPTSSRETTITPQRVSPQPSRLARTESFGPQSPCSYVQQGMGQPGQIAAVPHDPYPMDGMTMLCRPNYSPEQSLQSASARPSSRETHSEYSNHNSFSSHKYSSGKTSPAKQDITPASSPEKKVQKKKSGFFQNRSPFRRKSTKDAKAMAESGQNSWEVTNPRSNFSKRTASPEPVDANASLALGIGQNVLPVSTPDKPLRSERQASIRNDDQPDPIAQALAELKEVNLGKSSTTRVSADRYHGIATPAPGADNNTTRPVPVPGNAERTALTRGTPPPLYQKSVPVSRLGVPPPAVTSRAMKEATKKVADQTRSVFGHSDGSNSDSRGASPVSRLGTRGNEMPRAASPIPARSASPQPPRNTGQYDVAYRSTSPVPYAGANAHPRNSPQTGLQSRGPVDPSSYEHSSIGGDFRGHSPSRSYDYNRPQSSYSGSEMAVQLAPMGEDVYGTYRSTGPSRTSSRAMGLYDGGSRPRSKSVADPARQYSRDGRPILHFARAMYLYRPAIPEELGFAKGDYLAIFRHQDDGWWEAEVHGGNGRVGLVPSNYLQPC